MIDRPTHRYVAVSRVPSWPGSGGSLHPTVQRRPCIRILLSQSSCRQAGCVLSSQGRLKAGDQIGSTDGSAKRVLGRQRKAKIPDRGRVHENDCRPCQF